VSIVIRDARAEDAPGIALVNVLTWRSTYRGLVPDKYLDELSTDAATVRWGEQISRTERRSTFIVAEEDKHIIGYVICGPQREHDPVYDSEVYALYVLHDHQRRGIGRKLVSAAAETLLSQGYHGMLLWVLTHNHVGSGFYQAMGGKAIRTQHIEIGGAHLEETAYGWPDLNVLIIKEPQ